MKLTAGKDSIVVRFQARDGDETPEVFRCEIHRQVPGFTEKSQPITMEDTFPRRGAPIVDTVQIGDPDSERAHNLQGDNTRTAAYLNTQWRSAFDGGWFRYTMKVEPQALMMLSIVYYGGDAEGRDFDIFIDGKKLISISLRKKYGGNSFYESDYPIPESWTKNKTQIEVRFSAHPGNIAGGIYGCRIKKR